MKALIVAGGFGTRLNDLGQNTAKGLIEVKQRPIVDYIFENLANVRDIDEIFLTTNNKFYNVFLEWSAGKSVKVISNGIDLVENKLGAIGDISFAIKKLEIDDDLLILASDNLFDFSLEEIVKAFKTRGKSIVVVREDKIERMHLYGNVVLDENMRVLDFVEKPPIPKSRFAASCIYLYPRSVLPLFDVYMNEVKNHDQPGRFVEWLVKRNEEVYAYKITGRWFDVGNLETLKEAMKSYS